MPPGFPESVHAVTGAGEASQPTEPATSAVASPETFEALTSAQFLASVQRSMRVFASRRTRRSRYGPPEIFNSDQGSQCVDFTDVLKEAGIRISMDGKGRWMDNVFIERLWRSLKYECVYLSEFATGSQTRG